MPQTSDERRARWPGWDSEAIAFLDERGFHYTGNWEWTLPTTFYVLSEREEDAIIYLIEEFDWDGLVD